MDHVFVAGIRNDADDFGTGRLVGQVVVETAPDVALVDEVMVAELVLTNVALVMSWICCHHGSSLGRTRVLMQVYPSR